MIRHVSAVGLALCLSTATVFAQTSEPQSTELTVKVASADVHKAAMIASPVIGKAQSGTVLQIRRNLGSWVEVPWADGENGVAFLHVSTGTIARRATSDPKALAVTAATPIPAAVTPAASNTRTVQVAATEQPGARRPVYVSLPRHIVGVGGRMTVSSPGFGATVRAWSANRLGLQVEVVHSSLDSIEAPGRVTSFQFAPSLLYSLPDGMSDSLWVRPYVGAGATVHRATLSSSASGPETVATVTDSGLGFQTFGGAEGTFSGAPRLAISADIGYRWSQTSFAGFEPSKVRLSLAAHWYMK